MKISETLTSLRTWFASWFTRDNRDAVVVVIDHLTPYLESSLSIVKAIDRELKPALKTGHLPEGTAIDDFLCRHCDNHEAAYKCAMRVKFMPLPDLLVNVALFLLQQSAPNSASVSILRLAIEFAYNVYKGSKSEAKVS